jgi:Zn-dependent protease with chaperone function
MASGGYEQGAAGTGQVPGPVDREDFFAAQRRHRRQARRINAVAWVAAAIQSLIMGVIMAPTVFAAATVILDLGYLAGFDTPDPLVVFQLAGEAPDDELRRAAIDLGRYLVAAIPGGAFLMFLAWLLIRRSLRAGLGASALTRGFRPADSRDLEERQLLNLVDEMAIAAGARPPAVLMVDAPGHNIAAFGNQPDQATLVVPRTLLLSLDRRETGGLIAYQVGSITNGDLRIFNSIEALSIVWMSTARILSYPFAISTWRLVVDLFRLVLRRLGPAEEASLIRHILEDDDDPDGIQHLPGHLLRAAFGIVQVPAVFTVNILLGARVRRRRLLADATAVQLTRDPGALGGGVLRIAEAGGDMPGEGAVDLASVVRVGNAKTVAAMRTATPANADPRNPVNPGLATLGGASTPFGLAGSEWHPQLISRLRSIRRLAWQPDAAMACMLDAYYTNVDGWAINKHRPLRFWGCLIPASPFLIAFLLFFVVLILMFPYFAFILASFHAAIVWILVLFFHTWVRM